MSNELFPKDCDLRLVDNEEGLLFRAIEGSIKESQTGKWVATQFITFRDPTNDYLKLKSLCTYWKFSYTFFLRWAIRKLIESLENPSGELLELLEKNRAEILERQRKRKEAEARRARKSEESSEGVAA